LEKKRTLIDTTFLLPALGIEVEKEAAERSTYRESLVSTDLSLVSEWTVLTSIKSWFLGIIRTNSMQLIRPVPKYNLLF